MSGKKFRSTVACGLVVLFAVASLMVGCTGQKKKSENPFFDKWRETAERSKGFTPTRKKISAEDSAKKKLGYQARAALKPKPKRPLPTRRITVKLRDLEVAMVLRAIARAVDQNILLNAEVQGKVTVDVQNVPWDQVFLGVLKSQNLGYEWEGDIIRIMTVKDQDKEIQREIRTVIVPIEYADAVKLKENIQSILTTNIKGATGTTTTTTPEKTQELFGSVMVDEHNNALIIQASRADIQRLLPIIEALDRPTPQILIEAHIIEATKDTARELGVQWGGLYNDGNQWIYPGANSTGISGIPLPGGPATGGAIGSAVAPTTGWAGNFPASSVVAAGPGLTLGYMVGNLGQSLLQMQLSALQTNGKINILSSPSITTLDNHEALIESGKSVPFQTIDSNGNIDIEWRDAVLQLKVKPHVIDGGVLKMQILTTKDELDFTQTVLGNPTIIKKKAETNVVLLDGETTVIGGLNKETDTAGQSGVPGLMDLPILGWLFKVDSSSNELEEVLIFITPYILKERVAESGVHVEGIPESLI